MKEMKAKNYRALAAEKCKPMSGRLALIYFLYTILLLGISGLSFIPPYWTTVIKDPKPHEITLFSLGDIFVSIINFLIAGAFVFSFALIAMKVNKNERCDVEDVFAGFHCFWRAFIVNFVRDFFVALWTLLLIVPGIIKSLSYSMTIYIAIDNPNIGTLDAIDRSKTMMRGYKWKFFCLNISYIGWILLSILTLGILFFWVEPKMQQARYQFYLNLKNKNKTKSKQ